MDIIDVFLERHAALRRDVAALEAPFQKPHGVGWDDCVAVDCGRLMRDIERVFASFREHAASEDRFMAQVADKVRLDAATAADFEEGRRALAEIMKLLGAIAFTFDGSHVHRVRELLSRMRAEADSLLAFEEQTLFPLLRRRLDAKLLRDAGERERGVHGHPAR